jgi:hypothetical protein
MTVESRLVDIMAQHSCNDRGLLEARVVRVSLLLATTDRLTQRMDQVRHRR